MVRILRRYRHRRSGRPSTPPIQALCRRHPLLQWTGSTPVRYLHRRSVRGLIAPTPRQYQHRPWAPLTAWTPVRYRRHRLPPSIAQTLGRYPHRRSAPRRWTESRPVPSQLPRWGPRWNRRNRVPCPLRQLALLSSQLNPQPCRPPPLVPLRWTGSKPGRCLPHRLVLLSSQSNRQPYRPPPLVPLRWIGSRPGRCQLRQMRQSVELIRQRSRLPQRSRLLQRLLLLSSQLNPPPCRPPPLVPLRWTGSKPGRCLPHRLVLLRWTGSKPGRCLPHRLVLLSSQSNRARCLRHRLVQRP